jgi:hypothetical protein
MLPVGVVDIVSKYFSARSYADNVGIGRARGIIGNAIAVGRGREAMERSVAIAVDVAVIPDRVAGRVDTVRRDVDLGAGGCGNVDLFEVEI